MHSGIHSELTPLERSILQKYFERFQNYSFPAPSDVEVKSRKSTGSGRYTHLNHDGETSAPDGQLDLGKFSQINMDNMEHGASFWIYIKESKISYLEISINGDGQWNGAEGEWDICDPDTGEFSK